MSITKLSCRLSESSRPENLVPFAKDDFHEFHILPTPQFQFFGANIDDPHTSQAEGRLRASSPCTANAALFLKLATMLNLAQVGHENPETDK